MRKINLLQIVKLLMKKSWLLIVFAIIGVGGMMLTVKIQNSLASSWSLNDRYVILLDDRQDYYSYLYEEKMAIAVNDLLGRDKELRSITNTLTEYSTRVFNRRIELSIQDKDEETLMQAEHLFFEKAQMYLSEECTQAAAIVRESTEIEEVQRYKASMKEIVLLGALLGLCIGLSILLVAEYVKSPKA